MAVRETELFHHNGSFGTVYPIFLPFKVEIMQLVLRICCVVSTSMVVHAVIPAYRHVMPKHLLSLRQVYKSHG